MRRWGVLAGAVVLTVTGTVAALAVRHGAKPPGEAPPGTAPAVQPLSKVDSDVHLGWLPPDLGTKTTRFPPGAKPGTPYLTMVDFPADRGPDLRLDGWQPFEVGGRPRAHHLPSGAVHRRLAAAVRPMGAGGVRPRRAAAGEPRPRDDAPQLVLHARLVARRGAAHGA